MYSFKGIRTGLILVLFFVKTISSAQQAYEVTSNVNFRSGPGIRYNIQETIKKGEVVIVSQKNKTTWVKAEYKGTSGYLLYKTLSPIEDKKVDQFGIQKGVRNTSSNAPLLFVFGFLIVTSLLLFTSYYRNSTKTKNQSNNSVLNFEQEKIKPLDNTKKIAHQETKKKNATTEKSLTKVDDSIIDVTNQPCENINNLIETTSQPTYYWKNKPITSFNEIYSTNSEQRNFYSSFKDRFLKNSYVELGGNKNYLYILFYDLIREYEISNDINKLKRLINRLELFYPEIKEESQSYLEEKTKKVASSKSSTQNSFSPEYSYLGLGTRYQQELSLSHDEVEILNSVYFYSNVFFGIKQCATETIKLFLALKKEIDIRFKDNRGSLNDSVSDVADFIVTKQLMYRTNTESYLHTKEAYKRNIYSAIIKNCENAVREAYSYKRKLKGDLEYLNLESRTEFTKKILSKIADILPTIVSTIAKPEEITEIELNSQNPNRWKAKIEEFKTAYNGNPNDFYNSILDLAKLNKKNPSIENIFYEAFRIMSTKHKKTAISLYVYYLYYDLRSPNFDNKKLTNTFQKELFKTTEQIQEFEKLVSELIRQRDLKKALRKVNDIFEIKRKKIHLDSASIREVQKQHKGTIEILNEYLKEEEEDENIIKQQQKSDEIAISNLLDQQENDKVKSAFLTNLCFTETQISALELFLKSNYLVSEEELETFSKSKRIFKTQLVDSINEKCYHLFDDILIEQEDDCYTINTQYFQKILAE
jgi:uncharacterized protein YgiM (DUF1202 family)